MLDISKYLEISTNIDILGRQASASVCRAVCSESIKAQGKLGAICIILHSPGYCIITLYCRFCQSKILNYFPGCNCFRPSNPNICPPNLFWPSHSTQPLSIMKMWIYEMVVGDPKNPSQNWLTKFLCTRVFVKWGHFENFKQMGDQTIWQFGAFQPHPSISGEWKHQGRRICLYHLPTPPPLYQVYPSD